MALNKEDFMTLEESQVIKGIGVFGAIVIHREGEEVTLELMDGLLESVTLICVWDEKQNLITDKDGGLDHPIVKGLNGPAFTMKENAAALAERWLKGGVINQEQYGRLINAIATSLQEREDSYLPPGW